VPSVWTLFFKTRTKGISPSRKERALTPRWLP